MEEVRGTEGGDVVERRGSEGNGGKGMGQSRN